MALFEAGKTLHCTKCGETVFTEETRYMYKREKGQFRDRIARETAKKVLVCANPKCHKVMNITGNDFFKDTGFDLN